MRLCKQCGGEITNRLSHDFCVPCIERAMDDLTIDDISNVVSDMERRGIGIMQTNPDGTRERIDPVDFYEAPEKKQ